MFVRQRTLFGTSCAGCGEVIPPSHVVRRAHENIYHTNCFCCLVCNEPLNTGDEFYLRDDGRLICKTDYNEARIACQPMSVECQDDLETREPIAAATVEDDQLLSSEACDPMFSVEEAEMLRDIYYTCSNPTVEALLQICDHHRLDLNRVRLWFKCQHRKRDVLGEESYAPGHYATQGTTDGTVHAAMNYGNSGATEIERAVAPPGGYPLPIVNEAANIHRPLHTGCSHGDPSFRIEDVLPTCLLSSQEVNDKEQHCSWSDIEDIWQPDFIPPNVNLRPSDIYNGEVCEAKRGRTHQCLFSIGDDDGEIGFDPIVKDSTVLDNLDHTHNHGQQPFH